MREIIKRIAGYISRTNQYTEDQAEQIEYALRIMVFETLKVIGVIAIFSLMGHPIQAIVATVAMFITKPYIGGYHEDTQIKCFVATLFIVGSVIYLSDNLSLNFGSKIILDAVSLYCIWHQAPVINPKMDLTRTELITRNRILGMIISTALAIISLVTHKNLLYSDTITWTIVFQTLLMFNKRERTYH